MHSALQRPEGASGAEEPQAPVKPVVNLAIVGCGAIAERVHLKAADGLEGLRISALVDRDLDRAQELARRFSVPHAVAAVADLAEPPDAALLALPHRLHASMSIELMRQGIHVLVEKPMALTLADCDEMIRVSEATGARLAIGLARRFMPEVRLARSVVESGVLGEIRGFEARDGSVFKWRVTSDFLFRREESGGGVMADLGSHTLDTLMHCLGDLEVLEYADDSHRGVEAEAEARLALANGAEGVVKLSRTRDLGSGFRIRGTEATLKVDIRSRQVRLDLGSSAIDLTPKSQESGLSFFRSQLTDFVRSVATATSPAVPGSEGRRSVALVEECYRRRRPLELPWVTAESSRESGEPRLAGKRVLVTGGTGFLGGRLVEKLALEQGAEVRVLVRDFARASRIARFAPEMIAGEVTDPRAVARAVDGCDVVFHLASGNQGSFEDRRLVNVDGTENVAQAVLAAGVDRMVHVGTLSISEEMPAGDVFEGYPVGDPGRFSRTKIDAERRVLELHRDEGLPAVVIQPSCIYGPYDRGYTAGPIEQLLTGQVLLVDGGRGLCNLVYVDDVVDALILAAVEPAAVGEVFLISGESPVTWKDFYGAYERMLGVESTTSMTREEILSYRQQRQAAERQGEEILENLSAAGVEGSVEMEPAPFRIPSDHMLIFLSLRSHFRIDKAKRLLGYQPRFDFARGMRLTEQWARWAGLIPGES